MLINNINISNFKAKLMDRNISNAEFNVVNDWSTSSLNPVISDKFEYKYKTLSLTLDIVCNNADELETMKSNLIKQLTISTIKFDDISKKYTGFICESPSYSYTMPGNEIMNVKMLVYCTDDEVTESINRVLSKTINVKGNTDTPCIVEIIPSIDTIDLVINGLSDDPITIKNLKAGQKIIINGEDGTVLQNGANKFGDTDMWEFPRLKPRANTITVSRNNVDINIKYNPRWI